MFNLQVLGNLGADAELVQDGSRVYVRFNVCHSEKFTNSLGVVVERSQWVSCFLNRDAGALMQYLTKGAKVYVDGPAKLRVFDSAASHQKEAGISVNVRTIELCGGSARGAQPLNSQGSESVFTSNSTENEDNSNPPF